MSQDFYLSGAELIAQERQRQVNGEGFTPGHDDELTDQSLALVAVHYAAPPGKYVVVRDPLSGRTLPPWPHTWSKQWDKKKDHSRIRQLAIAGAECAAEIDRLKRKMLLELKRLNLVHRANLAGKPAPVFDLDAIGEDLVKREFLAVRDGGLWITEEGKAEANLLMFELVSSLPGQEEISPSTDLNLEGVLAVLQERQAGNV